MKKGISLIMLIITIIVIIILSTTIIISLTGENNAMSQAKKAKLLNNLTIYKEQIEQFKMDELLKDPKFDINSLYANKGKLEYNTKKNNEGSIKNVIPNISEEYFNKLEIVKGKCLVITEDKEELDICLNLGIKVNPYHVVEGEIISNDNNLLAVEQDGTLVIPNTVSKLGEAAFSNNDKIKRIIIPGNVKEIGPRAFSRNQVLEEVIIEEGIEIIGSGAFENCYNLKKIIFPKSLKEIHSEAFIFDGNLDNVIIPDNVENIENYTFYYCKNLKNIVLPMNLKNIKFNSLGVTGIKNISIPDKVEYIDETAFSRSPIDSINLNSNSNFVFENNILMTKLKDAVIYISPLAVENKNVFVIPNGLKEFNASISKYDNITKIKIPTSLEKLKAESFPRTIKEVEIINEAGKEPSLLIENNIVYSKDKKILFMCYSKQQEINLTEHLNNINQYAFNQATNMVKLYIKDCDYISSEIVYQNFKFKELILGEKVLNVHNTFFYQSTGIVTIDSKNPNLIVENNVLYSKDKTKLKRVLGKIDKKYTIDSKVKEIENLAFHGNSDIVELIIPGSVEQISSSFNWCHSLEKVIIEKGVNKISSYAFKSTPRLNEIIVKNKKDSILYAPWGCENGIKVVKWENN